MDEQRDVVDRAAPCASAPTSPSSCPARRWPQAYGERGRVRAPPAPLRVQPPLPQPSSRRPASCCSGTSPDGRLVEFIELAGHPFWVGTQAHPEFKSRPDRPAPLFRELVGAALARAEGRNPRSSSSSASPPLLRERDRRRASPASREREIYRGQVISLGRRHLRRPRRHHVRARRRPPPGRGRRRAAARRRPCRDGAPVPGARSTAACSRSRPASATWTASRPRRPPGASWPRRSASRPAGRAAVRVLQLARLLRRALPGLPGPGPDGRSTDAAGRSRSST